LIVFSTFLPANPSRPRQDSGKDKLLEGCGLSLQAHQALHGLAEVRRSSQADFTAQSAQERRA